MFPVVCDGGGGVSPPPGEIAPGRRGTPVEAIGACGVGFAIGITPGGNPGIDGTPLPYGDAPPPGIPVDIEPPGAEGVPPPVAEGAGPALASAAASGLTVGPYPERSITLSLLEVYRLRTPALRRGLNRNMEGFRVDQAPNCAGRRQMPPVDLHQRTEGRPANVVSRRGR